jgi:DNA ligase-1
VRYGIVAQAYRDLERTSARLALIDRLAARLTETPTTLLPTVALLCQGQIAPDFAGVDLGMAERLAARAVAQAAGLPVEEVRASARQVGDLGLAAEQLFETTAGSRPATLEVQVVVDTLHQIAQAQGEGSVGRKLAGLVGLLKQATPLGNVNLRWPHCGRPVGSVRCPHRPSANHPRSAVKCAVEWGIQWRQRQQSRR